jgi:hypothetical protein
MRVQNPDPCAPEAETSPFHPARSSSGRGRWLGALILLLLAPLSCGEDSKTTAPPVADPAWSGEWYALAFNGRENDGPKNWVFFLDVQKLGDAIDVTYATDEYSNPIPCQNEVASGDEIRFDFASSLAFRGMVGDDEMRGTYARIDSAAGGAHRDRWIAVRNPESGGLCGWWRGDAADLEPGCDPSGRCAVALATVALGDSLHGLFRALGNEASIAGRVAGDSLFFTADRVSYRASRGGDSLSGLWDRRDELGEIVASGAWSMRRRPW